MTTGSNPDLLVALWAKWQGFEWGDIPEGLKGEERERFTEQAADQADKVATKIISAPPDTLVGAFVQIAVLSYWADNGVPNYGIAALKRLDSRVKEVLQDATGQGATS